MTSVKDKTTKPLNKNKKQNTKSKGIRKFDCNKIFLDNFQISHPPSNMLKRPYFPRSSVSSNGYFCQQMKYPLHQWESHQSVKLLRCRRKW